MRRNILLVIIAVIQLVSVNTIWATDRPASIKIGIFDNYPVVFTDESGTPRGIYVELLNHIAARENWRIDYVFGTWAECIEGIRRNQIDLLTSVGRTEDREQFMRFSQENVLNMWGQVFFGPHTKIEDIFDLQNRKLAILKGGINGINFKKLLKSFDIQCQFVEVDSYIEAAQLVESGKIEACVLNNVIGSQLKQVHEIQASPIVFSPFKLLFSSPRNSRHNYLEVIDNHIRDWKAESDSLYYNVLQQWYSGGPPIRFVIPQWVKYTVGIVIPCLLISLLWVLLLHLQIRRRKKAEQDLAESEKRFHCLSDAAFEGVIITDQGRLLEVNDMFCEMFGYRPDEVIGSNITSFVPRSEQQSMMDKILSGHEKPYETKVFKKDGSEIPVEIHGRMLDYRGKVVRVAAIRDLSERKRAEKEREQLIEHLQATLEEIQTLRGILPICSYCKNIRNDNGYYEQIEAYIHKRSGVDFSHTICPACLEKHHPEVHKKIGK